MNIPDQLNEAEKIKVDEINTKKVNKIISMGLPIGLKWRKQIMHLDIMSEHQH